MNGTSDNEELRLALVLNGGVSLAVWIGGVTHEVNRLVRCVDDEQRPDIYGRLARLTETRPMVDVISGASAGGLNGALLALAMTRKQSLAQMRSLWIDRAAFGDLLRSPYDRAPLSLLDGDGYFLDCLREAFDAVKVGAVVPAAEVPVDLTLTATLLNGKAQARTDDFGNVVPDCTHRARFHFVRGAETAEDPFKTDPEIVDKLALASRATASFPGAFEATFCPVNDLSARASGRPNMEKHLVDATADRFVVDGGVLVNKPLRPALDAIYKRRARYDVRRVLMYVAPDPEKAEDALDDDWQAPPAMADVVLDSLVNLPRVESIAQEVDELKAANDRIATLRRHRFSLTRTISPGDLDTLADKLYALYRARRYEAAADHLLSVIAKTLEAPTNPRGLGRHGRREWLTRTFTGLQQPWVPDEKLSTALAAEAMPAGWRWGTRPVELAGQVTTDLLMSTQRIARALGHRKGQACLGGAGPCLHAVRIDEIWSKIFDAIDDLDDLREKDRAHWKSEAAALADALGSGTGDKPGDQIQKDVENWGRQTTTSWLAAPVRLAKLGMVAPSGRIAAGEIMAVLAARLIELRGVFDAVRPVAEAASRSQAFEAAFKDLDAHLGYFVVAPSATVGAVVSRLLRFEVVTRAAGDQFADREHIIDFIQVSGDGKSPLGGPSAVADKLAGVQLAHFGGFYKRSWRANDWMFGRLDASRRLVQVVLDPERLRVLHQPQAGTAAKIAAEIETIAVAGAPGPVVAGWSLPEVERELAYLDDAGLPVPERLPRSCDAIVKRMHYEILREELGHVYDACQQDVAEGAARRAKGVMNFATRYKTFLSQHGGSADEAQGLIDLLETGVIGKERFSAELGSDLFMQTASRSLAVAMAAGRAESSGLGPLRSVLKLMRAPALAAHLGVNMIISGTRTAMLLLGAAGAFAATVFTLWLTGGIKAAPFALKGATIAGGAAVIIFGFRWPRVVKWILGLGMCLAFGYMLVYGPPGPKLTLERWRAVSVGLAGALLLTLLSDPFSYLVNLWRRLGRSKESRGRLSAKAKAQGQKART